MQMSNAEKLMATLLAEIHQSMGIQGQVDAGLVAKAVTSNNTWALTLELSGPLGLAPEPLPPEVERVQDILAMWQQIEAAGARFSDGDRAQLRDARVPHADLRFPGFDPLTESRHLGIARFLVEELQSFDFPGRELKAERPMLDAYASMLDEFRAIQRKLGDRPLNVGEVVRILSL